eukprot:SAG31_NODE_2644_length_5315_cov_7.392063_5_plen_312_part_00
MPLLLATTAALLSLCAARRESDGGAVCRCRAQDGACWPTSNEWAALNVSIGGRLVAVQDELATCIRKGAASTECAADLAQTDDEFFYTRQVGGYMHTGLAAGGGQAPWSIAHNQSVFAVAATNAADVAAGVAFAATHNLRVSVKGTGHDWYAFPQPAIPSYEGYTASGWLVHRFGRSGSHPDFEGGLLICAETAALLASGFFSSVVSSCFCKLFPPAFASCFLLLSFLLHCKLKDSSCCFLLLNRFATETAGTHPMKVATWHEGIFVAEGCSADSGTLKGCYFLVFVQLNSRNTALIEKVSPCRCKGRGDA